MWKDMEIMKESWIVKRFGKYRKKMRNDMENMEEQSEKIWKIRKKILKRYRNYGRKYCKNMKYAEETQVE